jgi:hypothetical protein
MPPDPIKFRCEHCNQLLGVSPGRAGKPVNCPKCGERVTVPDPGAIPGAPPAPSPRSVGVPAAPLSSSGYFDAVDLDPDDLRNLFPVDPEGSSSDDVEPGSPAMPVEPLPPGPTAPPPSPSPEIAPLRSSSDEELALEEFEEVGEVPTSPGRGGASALDSIPELLRERPESPAIVEGRGPAESAPQRARSGRDVMIPRVAFLFWTLFILLSLFLAFVAGLLVGHFVWVRPG